MPTFYHKGVSPIYISVLGRVVDPNARFEVHDVPHEVTNNPTLFVEEFPNQWILERLNLVPVSDRGAMGEVMCSNFTGESTSVLVFWNGSAWAKVDQSGGGGGEANTLSTRGAGTSLAGAKAGVDLGVKSLVAGPGVALSSTSTEVTVSTVVPVLTESTTARTLALTDAGDLIRCNNAAAITVTVPTNASVAFPVGTTIAFSQAGAGQVTIAGAGGVTVNTSSTLKTRAQHSIIGIQKVDTDTWLAFGDLATS